MEENFLKPDFQFEKYINSRLMEISDEGERRVLKDVMRETLIPFYEQTTAYLAEIENRLEQTEQKRRNRFEVITGIARRDEIDLTEEALVPMQYGDLAGLQVDIEELKEKIAEGETYPIMKVFFRMDYYRIQELEWERRRFRGIIYTEDGEYPAYFVIERNSSYLKKIQELYHTFEQNSVQWNTVCAPYLYKFFDVFLVKTECPLDEPISKVTVDFEEYREYVQYDMVPMWNVRMMEEKTGAYPDLAIDQIHYDHCIYKGRFIEERDYMADHEEVKIWNMYRLDGDMHIICNEVDPVRWKLVEMGYDALKKQYDEPIFANIRQQSKTRCIHTYAEVKRYIAELGYEAYVELLDVKVTDQYTSKVRATYSMDSFMEDEIRVSKSRPYMIFQFAVKDRNCYLNQDIMSFLVSKVQWQLPEFACVGELQ